MTRAVTAWPPEPAPGVLWWGKTTPVCDPRVSAAGFAIPTCRALSPHASGNPALSWEDASRPCVPLYTARNTHTHKWPMAYGL